jgi:hypothetical protein
LKNREKYIQIKVTIIPLPIGPVWAQMCPGSLAHTGPVCLTPSSPFAETKCTAIGSTRGAPAGGDRGGVSGAAAVRCTATSLYSRTREANGAAKVLHGLCRNLPLNPCDHHLGLAVLLAVPVSATHVTAHKLLSSLLLPTLRACWLDAKFEIF